VIEVISVPYGSRTRVAAVKEKRPIVIQWNLAAWIALYRTQQTHGDASWTLNGLVFCGWSISHVDVLVLLGFIVAYERVTRLRIPRVAVILGIAGRCGENRGRGRFSRK